MTTPDSSPEGMIFPCEVDVKVFVRSGDELEQEVRELIGNLIPASKILEIRNRKSSQGKYQALSCNILAQSKEEIDQVFIALGKHPKILMVL